MNTSTYTQQVVSALNAVKATELVYAAMAGKRFDRVYWTANNGQWFVLCFVERETGDIHYAAGWKAPPKWKDGPAVEWHASEAQRYARFVRDGGWGYKGDRKTWEANHPEPEVEEPKVLPERFDIKALAKLLRDSREFVEQAREDDVFTADYASALLRDTDFRYTWSVLTGTTDFDQQDGEVDAVLSRTAHVAYTSDLT